jgi:hypothetical protein
MGLTNDPRKGTPSAGNYPHLNRITDSSVRDAYKHVTDKLIELRQEHDANIGRVTQPLTQDLNGNDRQLKSIRDPVDPQDAVTLQYLQTYVANYATAQGGSGTGAGGGTGGGTPAAPTVDAPNYSSIVGDVWASLGINSGSSPFELFKFAQTVVWQIAAAQPPGETAVGLLHQDAGDGVFTCDGQTYACFRICFDNGANIKILTGSFTAQWTQEADVPLTDWRAPTNPATSCP